MKKGPILIIVLSLVAIGMLLSFGSIKPIGTYESVTIEFKNKEGVLYLTPDSSTDVVAIPNSLMAIGASIESLKVGNKVLTDDLIIYINDDRGKDYSIKIKNLWGVKEYKVILELKYHVQFHVDDELVKIVNKDDVAKEINLPDGDYNWFTDKELTKPFDLNDLNDTYMLYAES